MYLRVEQREVTAEEKNFIFFSLYINFVCACIAVCIMDINNEHYSALHFSNLRYAHTANVHRSDVWRVCSARCAVCVCIACTDRTNECIVHGSICVYCTCFTDVRFFFALLSDVQNDVYINRFIHIHFHPKMFDRMHVCMENELRVYVYTFVYILLVLHTVMNDIDMPFSVYNTVRY